MGVVSLAEDTLLGRQVALKQMTAADPHNALRLRREALIGASISHSNLVSVYDVVSSEDGELVVVMEYVEGETLASKLGREGRLPGSEAVRILGGVAAALDAIHGRGIVHRDVKPPNILLGSAGAVKLADLGVASVPDRTRITSSGAVVGSLRYMAPEQVENGRSTKAIDIYALAAVAFEVLSGRKARLEDNPLALAHAIATHPPPDLRTAWPEAPAPAAALLERAMSRDPRQRPSSAGELVDRLEKTLVAPVAPRPARRPTKPARPATRARPARAPGPVRTAAAGRTPARARPLPARHRGQWIGVKRRPRWALGAAALVALVLAAALAALIAEHGRQHEHGRDPASGKTTPSHGGASKRRGSGTTSVAGAGSTSAGSSPPASVSSQASTPIAAVESFYRLGATHRYGAAWSLADPAFRSQLGSYNGFADGQAQVRSVRFDSAQVVGQSGSSATVALRTTSVHTDGSHQCSGTVEVVDGSAGRGWFTRSISTAPDAHRPVRSGEAPHRRDDRWVSNSWPRTAALVSGWAMLDNALRSRDCASCS